MGTDHPADHQQPVELIERERVFDGYFKIDRYRLRHALFRGGAGPAITREVFERGHAVCVLPYDPARDRVLLIEQFRVAPFVCGERAWLIEVVAGIIEPGETAPEVARREAREEAGLQLDELIPMFRCYASPGGSTETMQHYAALTDLPDETGGVHGLEGEAEDIRVFTMRLDEALAAIEAGRIISAPAILALQWLGLNRDRLRRAAP